MASILKVGERWRAQIRRVGQKSITKTFEKKAHAEIWARRTEEQLRGGEFYDERRLADFTIGGLIDQYTKEVGAKEPFGRSKAGALAIVKANVGDKTLAQFDSAAVLDYARRRAASKTHPGGVTISVELTYLSAVLKVAVKVWGVPLKANPVQEARHALEVMNLVGKGAERDRRPTQGEIDRLCAYFEGKPRQRVPMATIIRFAIATAMRASEITGLRWADLNEQDRTIVIRDRKHPQAKIGNNQTVPLLGEAFIIVSKQPRGGEFIFPYKAGTFSSIFPRACQALGIEDLRFHDLRHEGVSRLFAQGYGIEEVALVSGHRDWKMLRRYTQVRAKDMHRGLVLVSNGGN